jgi:protein-S-isoprenylcysteine O-methyltransferase Ste14
VSVRTEQRMTRGTAWVVLQMPLLGAAIALPVVQWMLGKLTAWPLLVSLPLRALGLALLVGGVWLFRQSKTALGPYLIAFPRPADGAPLLQDGIYGRVRHPMYGAIMLCIVGWALVWSSLPALVLATITVLFFLCKLRFEEGLLRRTFPAYDQYSARVPAIIPRPWKRDAGVRE